MADGDVILDVSGLTANIGDKPILKGIDFKVRKGEVHAIMGPNGSGKSTFSKVLVGHPAYEVSAAARRGRGTGAHAGRAHRSCGRFLRSRRHSLCWRR